MIDIQTYLERIGIEQIEKTDLEFLSQLQMQHVLHVPFENLDVINHVLISLDTDAFYKKIVKKNRGGFCYELNGLFNHLLEKLGFQTHLISGTIYRGDGSWARKNSHAAMIVQLDQPYVVDVGFGNSARKPVPLTGENVRDVSGNYRLLKIDEQHYDMQREGEDGEWGTLYRLDMTPKELNDFSEQLHYNQTSPDSHFTHRLIVTIATEDGRYSLVNDHLTITKDEEKQKIPVEVSERKAVIKKYFQMDIPFW